MKQLEAKQLIPDKSYVRYAGGKYKVAEISTMPGNAIFIGIYDEPPSLHVDYLNADNVEFVKEWLDESHTSTDTGHGEKCNHDWQEYKQCCYCGAFESFRGEIIDRRTQGNIEAIRLAFIDWWMGCKDTNGNNPPLAIQVFHWFDTHVGIFVSDTSPRVMNLESIIRLKEKERQEWADMCIKKQARIEQLEEKSINHATTTKMTSEQIKRQLEAIKEATKEACKTKESAIKFLTDAGIIPPPTAHIEELSECYFTPDKKTSSATICVNCGKEKMLHTIGDGLKATSIEINPKPVTEELSTPPVREVKGAEEVVIDLRNESALYAKRQGSHDNPDTTAHDFFEGAQFGVQYASRFTTHKEGYSVDGWVRVEDGLPELRVPVLVYMSYGKIDTCYWTGELWNQSVRPQHSNGSVTHWQPLPQPPINQLKNI